MARFLEKDKERNVTVFGKNTTFRGVLKFAEELQIAGTFEGSIESGGTLVIRKGSACTVDHIHAGSITVEGAVTGDLAAADFGRKRRHGIEHRIDIRHHIAASDLDRRGVRQDGPLWRALGPLVRARARAEE